MNDRYERLRQLNWRRQLTADEAAELRDWLMAHPEAELDWESEVALSQGLGRLADAPVPSNFTSRVLKAAIGESAPSRPGWRWRSFLPKAAVAGLVVGLGWFSYEQHRAGQRVELARHVAIVSGVAAPGADALQDFETIRLLGQTPAADEELLALLE